MFSVATAPLDPAQLNHQLSNPKAGALVTFEGWVRNHNDGRQVLALSYEAFEPLCKKEAEEILAEARKQFDIYDALCVHRAGDLAVGDLAVWVGVTSAHRDTAFSACRFIIDQIKIRLPIWKKETYVDGKTEWVNCQACAEQGHSGEPGERIAEHVHGDEHNGHAALISVAQAVARVRNDHHGVCRSPDIAPEISPETSPEISPETSPEISPGISRERNLGPNKLSEREYYSRQVSLAQVQEAGQERLKRSRVLVIGAGGLGSSALLYLAGAGVGEIGICDSDAVEPSNLHRQVIFDASQLGKNKAVCAQERLSALNPFIKVMAHPIRFTRANAESLFGQYDIVLDCSDNFETKFLANDCALITAKTLIQASVHQYEGQLQLLDARNTIRQGQCLRCLWPEASINAQELNCVASCAEAGVLGVVPGAFGTLQACETVKCILGLPTALTESVLFFDLLSYSTRLVRRKVHPSCVCQSQEKLRRQFDAVISPANQSAVVSYSQSLRLAMLEVIDVREREEVANSPVKPHDLWADALIRNIPLGLVENDFGKLDIDKSYLFVCARGKRSAQAANEFIRKGATNVFSLMGGLSSCENNLAVSHSGDSQR